MEIDLPLETVEAFSIPTREEEGLFRHMGDTGCIRPWRIWQRLQSCQGFKSGRTLQKPLYSLQTRGLVRYIHSEGIPLRWHWGRGLGRSLIELTADGRHYYRLLKHKDPAPSELTWVKQMHVSPRHALAILEARDHLRCMGLQTDDDPPPCPQSAEDPLGPRSEPDLLTYWQNRVFPVEVQRETGSRYIPKWEKSLYLYQRLMIITFTEASLQRQGADLILARQRGLLPTGRILLASLERFENSMLTFSSA